MNKPIDYIEYDKISDDLLFLGNNTILRFYVKLSKRGEDGTRYHFHKEYSYNSNYTNIHRVASIKRSFEYYLSIDKIDSSENNIMIRVQDILLFRMKLNEIVSWFNDKTFAIKKDRLIVLEKKSVEIPGLAFGKYIKFEPIVIDWESTQYQGIRITLSDENVFTDISIDKFYGLVYTINEINMYQSAQILLNYLGRPEFGTNLYEFENGGSFETIEPDTKAVTGRKIPVKNKSFFDRMDEM